MSQRIFAARFTSEDHLHPFVEITRSRGRTHMLRLITVILAISQNKAQFIGIDSRDALELYLDGETSFITDGTSAFALHHMSLRYQASLMLRKTQYSNTCGFQSLAVHA